MRDTVVKRLTEFAEEDCNAIVVAGDLGYGAFDKFREKFPGRFLNAGICEQAMASIAAGMALEGKKVFLYSIGNFSTLRCIEQIRNDICYHQADVTVIASGGGFSYGSLGMSHHATEDLAMMRSLPGMRVYVPADTWEADAAIQECCARHVPCYLRLGKGSQQVHKESLPCHMVEKALLIRKGKDACIFASGTVLQEAAAAAQMLSAQGISVELYSFCCIKPIDKETIVECAGRFSSIITLEEHNVIGGLGSAVSESVAENGLGAKVIRLGIQDVYASVAGSQAYLRKRYGIDAQAVAEAARSVQDEKYNDNGRVELYRAQPCPEIG